MTKRQSHFFQGDLILILLLFITVSLFSIYNAQQMEQYADNFVMKQIVFYGASIFALIVIQFFDLEQLYKASLFIYAFGILIIIALYLTPAGDFAPIRNGAKSWFVFEQIGLSLQPSEFTKIAFIVYLAAVVSKHKDKFKESTIKSDLFLLLKIVVVTGIPFGLIFVQPDLGTSLIFVFIAVVVVLLSGIDWKIIATIVTGVLSLAAGAVALILYLPELAQAVGIKAYQMNRVLSWFDPTHQSNDTFQIDRSMQAVGSGQLTGKGIGNLQVYLPEAHSDMIFSVIGESFGFIGSAAVVFLYFFLFYKLITLGLRVHNFSVFGSFICFGYFALLLIHTFENIGMTINVMPITGIPLLLISYGGSAVLASVIGYALIYRVAVENSIQNDYLFK
ncbi:FtsW/RodA/SpoVE family cell cycle protein [Ornithinibacillus sp. 4-3]|uniref:FtsW/RodA/SpoVE family cell cycle protein n=1 Tax=Ornithinibacillus sp. 4-3 TaxID=3231488 RepID=A0AB39HSP6_9BACI